MTNGIGTGREVYSDYDALWHLVCMGVIGEDHAAVSGATAVAKGAPTRVAMIDVSVAVDHPNLADAINRDLAFDVFSTRLGAFPYRTPQNGDTTERLGAIEINGSTQVAEDLPEVAKILAELIDRLSPSEQTRIDGISPAVMPEFSGHGTAIAGLIGARPTCQPLSGDAGKTIPLPYRGVDPDCEIVPISTNFDLDPEVLIVAFLYAELIDADVIVLPRIIPDPDRTTPELRHTKVGEKTLDTLVSPDTQTERHKTLWGELAQLIINVSMNRPVVCAGGNANESDGIYPANLANDGNGIISVGAVNAKGYRSGFSALNNPTVIAPSNDSEVFDADEVRLDEQRHDYSSKGVPSNNENYKFSHFDVISTDVPGVYGYSRSPFRSNEPDLSVREFGSYYCRFGGTSASSALVAGYLALGQSSGAVDKSADGLEKKAWLLSRCATVTMDDGEFLCPAWDGEVVFPHEA